MQFQLSGFFLYLPALCFFCVKYFDCIFFFILALFILHSIFFKFYVPSFYIHGSIFIQSFSFPNAHFYDANQFLKSWAENTSNQFQRLFQFFSDEFLNVEFNFLSLSNKTKYRPLTNSGTVWPSAPVIAVGGGVSKPSDSHTITYFGIILHNITVFSHDMFSFTNAIIKLFIPKTKSFKY